MKPNDGSPNVLTPPQLAKEWGVDVDKVYAFIRSNELRATNTAIKPGGRAISDTPPGCRRLSAAAAEFAAATTVAQAEAKRFSGCDEVHLAAALSCRVRHPRRRRRRRSRAHLALSLPPRWSRCILRSSMLWRA